MDGEEGRHKKQYIHEPIIQNAHSTYIRMNDLTEKQLCRLVLILFYSLNVFLCIVRHILVITELNDFLFWNWKTSTSEVI